jgi:SAM-dependent methyltransferase
MSSAEDRDGDGGFAELRGGILQLCTQHRLGNLLFASVALGLYDHIPEQGATAEDVGRACNIDAHAARVLLRALAAAEVIDTVGSRFFVPPEHAPLLRSGPRSLIPHIKLLHQESEYWLRAAEILRPEYKGPLLADVQFRSESVSAYLDLVEWNNHRYPVMLWDALGARVDPLRDVLDVGPGLGYFSEQLLCRNEHVVVTCYDIENALRRCRDRHGGRPYFARMRWEPGEAPALPYHARFDLVMANDLFHYFTSAEKLIFLRALREALKPAGRLAIVKFRLNADGTTPASAAVFSFKMFLTTHRSHLETDEELELLAKEAGFRDVECIALDEFKVVLTAVR